MWWRFRNEPPKVRMPTLTEVQIFKRVHGCSQQEAVKRLRKEAMISAAYDARSVKDLRIIILYILEEL